MYHVGTLDIIKYFVVILHYSLPLWKTYTQQDTWKSQLDQCSQEKRRGYLSYSINIRSVQRM